MKKDAIICLRINSRIRDVLKEKAEQESRSLSSLLEIIINEFIDRDNPSLVSRVERRRFNRKSVSFPGIVQSGAKNNGGLNKTVVIQDISLNGVRIAFPDEDDYQVLKEGKVDEFDIFFRLPNEQRPVSFKCKTRRLDDTEGDVRIGAFFSDADFDSYQALQNFLV